MALEGHRTLLCAEVVDWLVLVACFRDIRGFARKREAVSAHAETSLPFSRSHVSKLRIQRISCAELQGLSSVMGGLFRTNYRHTFLKRVHAE